MIEEDRRYQVKREKDRESKGGRALRQTSLISILPRTGPDSNLRGKKNKYSVANFFHHLFILVTDCGVSTMYHAVCRALGTLAESDAARPPRHPGSWETDVEIMVLSQHDQCRDRRTCPSSGRAFPSTKPFKPGLSLRATPPPGRIDSYCAHLSDSKTEAQRV